MQTLHPRSSTSISELARTLLDAGSWTGPTQSEATDVVAVLERVGAGSASDGTPTARVMQASALRLCELSKVAYDAFDLIPDGRDMSWLKEPVMMDQMQRDCFAY